MQTGGHEKSRPCLSCENRDSLAASKSPPFENREGRGSPLLAGAPARHEERSNCWTGIPRNATLHNRAAQGLDVRHLPSPSPCGRGEVFSLDIPFYRTRLRYIHRNPVKRGLVEEPQDWPWSSFRHYLSGAEGVVEIESQWTARKRERMGVMPQIVVQSQIPRPFD